jgi:PAS domain S-box-containing protein
MSEKEIFLENLQQLRALAERRLTPAGKKDISEMSPEDIAGMIHELETHRIELELQNDELRQTQVKLTEARDQLSELYDFAPVGYITLDPAGLIVQANLTFANMLGVARDQLIRQPLSDYVATKDQDVYFLHKREVFGTQKRQCCELCMIPQSGESLWVGLESVWVGNAAGEGAQIRSVVHNISGRKQAEEAKERLAAAIGQVAEAVVITDREGVIQYTNPAFERITGYTGAEVMGQNPRVLKSGEQDAAFYEGLWETIARGDVWVGQFINKKKDGTRYTEEATISPVRNASGQIMNYVAVKRDITEEILQEEQFRQAQKMDALGHLVGGVAHDFNNILQAVNGCAELALEALDPQAPAFGYVNEVAAAGARAAALVQQLLAFTRQQVIHPVDLDLNEVVASGLQMLRRALPENIALDFSPARDSMTVHMDRGQVEQVLMNLCVNARDAMPDGGRLTIDTADLLMSSMEEATSWAVSDHYARLRIKDAGCGMDKQTARQIFEPFFTTKGVGKGTGLGLSTVFGILEQNGGHIDVDSEAGKGTTFIIYLPVVERVAQQVSEPIRQPVVKGAETILVAEDDETVLTLAKLVLRSAGYTVMTAKDGLEALQQFEEHSDEIDLVLFDVVMPRMGGKEAMQKILELRPGLPHLFASGYTGEEVHGDLLEKQSSHLLTKPYPAKVLLQKIRELLDA